MRMLLEKIGKQKAKICNRIIDYYLCTDCYLRGYQCKLSQTVFYQFL